MTTQRERAIAHLASRRAFVQASDDRRKLRRQPPEQRFPSGVRARYAARLSRLISEIEARLLAELAPELAAIDRESESLRALDGAIEIRQDALADRIVRLFRQMKLVVGEVASDQVLERMAQESGKAVSDFNLAEVDRQFLSVVGIDIAKAEPYLGEQLRQFISENASLVRSITVDEVPKLEQVVLRGVRRGTSSRDLTREIRSRFGLSKKRARLIARDQVSKLNGELTELRQRHNGVTHYIWQTSQDERVRPDHAALNNTRHSWKRPPVVDGRSGRREHPGGDFQCRCNALPDLSGILKSL